MVDLVLRVETRRRRCRRARRPRRAAWSTRSATAPGDRSGSRSSKRWSPAIGAPGAGSALQEGVDDALGERYELRHAAETTRRVRHVRLSRPATALGVPPSVTATCRSAASASSPAARASATSREQRRRRDRHPAGRGTSRPARSARCRIFAASASAGWLSAIPSRTESRAFSSLLIRSQLSMISSMPSTCSPAKTCGLRRTILSTRPPATSSTFQRSSVRQVLGEPGVQHDLQQHVAQLLAQRVQVAGDDRVVRLVALLEQVRREGRGGSAAASTGRRRATPAGPSPRPRPAAGRRAGPRSRTSARARPGRARGPAAARAAGRTAGRRPARPARPTVPCAAIGVAAGPGRRSRATVTGTPAARSASACSPLGGGEDREPGRRSQAAAVSSPAGSRGEVTSRTIRPARRHRSRPAPGRAAVTGWPDRHAGSERDRRRVDRASGQRRACPAGRN